MKPAKMSIRRSSRSRPFQVSVLFDTGSEEGLIHTSVAARLVCASLPDPVDISGIAGGSVAVSQTAMLQVRVLGKWCRYSVLVVPDDAVDVDLLVGEDFLLKYGLRLNPRRNRVEIENPLQFRRMTARKLFVASPRGGRCL